MASVDAPIAIAAEDGEFSIKSKKPVNATTAGSSASVGVQASHQLKALSFGDFNKMADSGDAAARAVIKKCISRGGGRSAAGASELFDRIPAIHRSTPAEALRFLDKRDASHVISRANIISSGKSSRSSNAASNIEWELQEANRARGSANMTVLERKKIALTNNFGAIKSAAVVGAVVSGGIAAFQHGNAVLEGSATEAEAGRAVLGATVSGGVSAAGFAVISILSPPVGLALGVGLLVSLTTNVAAAGVNYASPEFAASCAGVADRCGVTGAISTVSDGVSKTSAYVADKTHISTASQFVTSKASSFSDHTRLSTGVGKLSVGCATTGNYVAAGLSRLLFSFRRPLVHVIPLENLSESKLASDSVEGESASSVTEESSEFAAPLVEDACDKCDPEAYQSLSPESAPASE